MKNRVYLFLIISFIFNSCQPENIHFEEVARVDNSWEKDDVKAFFMPVEQKGSNYNFYLIVRNNNQYPYRNIYLFTKLKSPKGEVLIDTLEYQLADPAGKWLGYGMGEIKQNTLVYKENISLQDTGIYQFQVIHAMREDNLKGIEDISLMVEKK